jgi:O-antigen ligase
MTIEALIQEAYTPRVIYGLWRPPWDWAVFGPYVNQNLFAGYMLMALPLGAGLAAESLEDLRRAWRRRRRRAWLALGDADASAFSRRAAVSMVLVVGLLATRSRGAVLGLLVWALTVPIVARKRWVAGVAVALVVGLGIAWLGFETHLKMFQARGVRDSARILIWQDSLRLVPLHPVLGSGLNAFGTALPPRQRVFPTEWIGTTHNEYLQSLVDMGVVGLVLTMTLVVILLRRGVSAARQGSFYAGVFGSVVAVLAHNLVDRNRQLPANAATFVA